MERSLRCSVCLSVYNESGHLPISLRCNHTYCRQCLETSLTRAGRIHCPLCKKMSRDSLDTLPLNQALLDMIHNLAVSCKIHEVNASDFCLKHIVPVCSSCTIHTGCPIKPLIENLREIKSLVDAKIAELIPKLGGKLTRNMSKRIGDRFIMSFRKNVALLQEMELLSTQLVCCNCNKPADLMIDLRYMNAYCKQCGRVDPYDQYLISLERDSGDSISRIMTMIQAILREVNFCDLPLEFYRVSADLHNVSLKEVQELGQLLIQLASIPRKGYDALPQTFTCPECKVSKDKATTKLRVLPCTKLHAVCETCAERMDSQAPSLCPLDGTQFFQKVTEMELMEPPPNAFLVMGQGQQSNPLLFSSKIPGAAPSQPEEPILGFRLVRVLLKSSGLQIATATSQKTGQEVVIKSYESTDVESIKGPMEAGSTQARVTHPNSCTLLEIRFFTKNDPNLTWCVHLIMESLAMNLRANIDLRARANNGCTENELFSFLRQVGSVLAYAKTKAGNYKVGDFGWSWEKVKSSGYFSPEIRRKIVDPEQVKYDPFKSDIYSLGVTFLHLATLTSPDELNTTADLEGKITAAINKVSQGETVKYMLRQLLAIDPNSRPTIEQIAEYFRK